MVVLLRVEDAFPDGTTHVVPTLYPSGGAISKDDRERAEHLDSYLQRRMPEIASELDALGVLPSHSLDKWRALGQRLTFVEDRNLVSLHDKESGAIWLAVRQHAPPSLLPKGDAPLTPKVLAEKLSDLEVHRRLGKRHDHFERCYKLGRLPLADVQWMTWSDFDAYLESPGLERDARILPLLAKRAADVRRRLSRQEIRSVFKQLREAIPTKQNERDTTSLPQGDLDKLVADAFERSGL